MFLKVQCQEILTPQHSSRDSTTTTNKETMGNFITGNIGYSCTQILKKNNERIKISYLQ